jgi:hypothetical protein
MLLVNVLHKLCGFFPEDDILGRHYFWILGLDLLLGRLLRLGGRLIYRKLCNSIRFYYLQGVTF